MQGLVVKDEWAFCATSIYVQTIEDPQSKKKTFWTNEVRPVDYDAKQNKTLKSLSIIMFIVCNSLGQ